MNETIILHPANPAKLVIITPTTENKVRTLHIKSKPPIEKKRYFPVSKSGVRIPYSEMIKCLKSADYECLIDEKDYTGFGKGVAALCPLKHRCTVRYVAFKKGHTCCSICNKSVAVSKRKATNIKKYGVTNVLCNPEIRKRYLQKNIDKYGFSNPACAPAIREKITQTNIEKYGGPAPLSDPAILAKARATNLKRYGFHTPGEAEEVKEKMRQTNMIKYGGPAPMCDPLVRKKFKETCLQRYGVENVSQDPEIYKRCLNASYYKKKYTLPSGRIITVQGYEGFCLDDLFRNGYNESSIITDIVKVPTIEYYFDSILRKYYPDIYIPSENKIIEVKSTYTFDKQYEKNLAKAKACIDKGYVFEFRIYNEKGKLLNTIIDVDNI